MQKTKTAVNFVKPKPNQKLQFFTQTELKSLFANRTTLVDFCILCM